MSTTFKLVGGLGNQMFIFVAGRYVSEFLSRDVVFVDGSKSLVGGNRTHRNSSLESLTWGIGGSLTNYKYRLSATFLDAVAGVRSRLGIKNRAVGIFPSTYTSRVLGYDEHLSSIHKSAYVRGYFQTPFYFDELVNRGLLERPSVVSPSAAFLRARDEFQRSRPIIMHMRRGDYLDNSSFGVLSADYYKSAILSLKQRGLYRGKDVWIFSDSIRAARELAVEIGPDARALSDHYSLSVAEELLLMTEGSSNVISNSTFSWWGAKLSTSSLLTISPNTWFKGDKTSNELRVEGWLEIESRWL